MSDTLSPDTKVPTKPVSFRPPVSDYAWLKSHVAKGRNLSFVASWAVRMGREYVTALGDIHAKVTQLAEDEGLTRARMVATLLRLGLEAFERDRKKAG